MQEIKKMDGMNKRLKIALNKFNKMNWIKWEIKKYNIDKYNSKRIIFGTLKPNCDKSLK